MRGAKYRKVDLQIHTPASKCYEQPAATAEQIVEAAIKQGLEIIAITDHNTTEFVDRVRDAAKGTPLHVFPGVEITTAGGHILALFDRDRPLKELDDLLPRVGILADMRGKKEAIGKDAETVIKEIDGLGGIAIAAHANSSNGVLQNMQGQHRIRICSMPELSALEFTNRKDVENFSAGRVSGYPKKACVQNSDAHAVEQIGCRFTYLKMDIVSLNGVRQAILDHDVKVKFEWHDIALKSPQIVSLSASEGFFRGTTFDLHPHLNCFVGGKGTGKSTAIELLRYAFNDLATFDDIRDDTLGKALTLVGTGAVITVRCIDEIGQEFVIQRQVSEDHDEQPVCRDTSGEIARIPFRPVFFSQGEIVRVASSHLAQMNLVDAYIDIADASQAEATAIAQLEKNRVDISQAEERLAGLRSEVDDPKTGKKVTAAEVTKLERALKEPILKEFPKLEGEKRFVDDRIAVLEQIPDAIQAALDAVEVEEQFAVDLAADAPNAKTLAPLQRLPKDVVQLVKASANDLQQKLRALRVDVEKTAKEWERQFTQKRKEYEQVVAKSKEKSLAAVQSRLSKTKKHLETLLKAEKDIERIKNKLDNFRAVRRKEIEALGSARRRRFDMRMETAARWQTQLGGKVKISISHLGGRGAYAAKLKDLLKGSWVHEKDQQTAIAALDPSKLVDIVQSGDPQPLVKAGVPADPAQKMIEFLAQKPYDLLALDGATLLDLPEIAFEVEPGTFKSLNTLSVGGKGTVVTLLAMIEGTAPLIIDQPEDSLDTLFIYEQIVKKVRQQKETRQFIFATHNPNVLVSADADLSFVLEATAEKGVVRSHGGIDRKDTNELLLLHLEGGDAAFKARGSKYRR
jgi:hypothetical protein